MEKEKTTTLPLHAVLLAIAHNNCALLKGIREKGGKEKRATNGTYERKGYSKKREGIEE